MSLPFWKLRCYSTFYTELVVETFQVFCCAKLFSDGQILFGLWKFMLCVLLINHNTDLKACILKPALNQPNHIELTDAHCCPRGDAQPQLNRHFAEPDVLRHQEKEEIALT